MNAGDVFTDGLTLLYLHHERDGTHEHAVSLFDAWVAPTMIHRGIGHLLLTYQTGQHIAEGCLEQLVGSETLLFAPVVHQLPADIGRLLSHLAHRILGMCRQRGQLHTSILLSAGSLRLLVCFVANACSLVFGSLQDAIFLCLQRFAFVGQRQVALWEEHQITGAVRHQMVDIQQHIVEWCDCYQFNA